MNNISHNKSGFVVLIAIILSTIVLSIALGVSKIALKEINFSSSGLATGEAQFAADTGVECALANDKYSNSAFIPSGPGSITCLGSTVSLSGTYPSFDFILSGLGVTGGGCAKVNVYKDDVTRPPDIITTITSQGYNISGGSSCNSTSPNRVEREFVAIVDNSAGVSSGTTFVRSGGGTGSSFDFDVGPSGADRLVVVMADNESTGTNLTGVTVDSKACNLIARADNNLSGANHSEMWYCDEDDLGASSDTVTVAIVGGGASWAVHAHLYIDASQSGPSDFGIDNTSVGQTTINVANIDVPDDGLVVMSAANGQSGSYLDDGWTSSLIERTDSPNPSSAVLATASGKEPTAQTDKTYTATGSIANNRGTGIVAVWDPIVIAPSNFGLGVTLAGGGTGTVSSNPAGIDCGVDCAETYADGTVVALTPTPSGGSSFAGWSGDADCSDGSVTMSVAVSCTATFALDPITLDSVSDSNIRTGSPIASPITWNHTIGSGNNRILIVTTASRAGNPSGVTFNGVAMNKIRGDLNGIVYSNMWYLVNPPVGTYPVSVSVVNANNFQGNGISLFNVNQSNPVDVHNGANASSSGPVTVTLATSTADTWVVDVAVKRTAASEALNMTAMTNRVQRENSLTAVNGIRTGVSTVGPAASIGSYIMRWTTTNSNSWAISAAAFKQ